MMQLATPETLISQPAEIRQRTLATHTDKDGTISRLKAVYKVSENKDVLPSIWIYTVEITSPNHDTVILQLPAPQLTFTGEQIQLQIPGIYAYTEPIRLTIEKLQDAATREITLAVIRSQLRSFRASIKSDSNNPSRVAKLRAEKCAVKWYYSVLSLLTMPQTPTVIFATSLLLQYSLQQSWDTLLHVPSAKDFLDAASAALD